VREELVDMYIVRARAKGELLSKVKFDDINNAKDYYNSCCDDLVFKNIYDDITLDDNVSLLAFKYK